MAKHHIIAGVLGATLLVSALPGLALGQDEDTFAAEGLTWRLDSYLVDGVMASVPDEVEVTLLLDGADAAGSGGCNSYFGSYEMTAETLTFGPIGSTLALCDGPAQDVETAYLALLPAVAGWVVDEQTLALSDDAGSVTLLYNEAPVQITGSEWLAMMDVLDSLQAQIDALNETVASSGQDDLSDQVAANTAAIDTLQTQVDNQIRALRNRVKDNEAVLDGVVEEVASLNSRIAALEKQYGALDERVSALENGEAKPK
jgi:heat shock protein HslJ/uncharacterized coiled-coil protein SlyX